MEINPALASKQVEPVDEVKKKKNHLKCFHVECQDATDRSGWGNVKVQPCWVIMLEGLDKFPHDLTHSEDKSSPWVDIVLEGNASLPS